MSRNIHIDTGSYAGNGTSQSISIGWQPAEVIIVSSRATGPTPGRAAVFKNSAMPTPNFLKVANTTSVITANGVTLGADGFSVGSNDVVNLSGITFYWIAFRQSSWVDVVSYTGDGVVAGQAIVTGRQPNRVSIAQTSGAARLVQKLFQTGASAVLYTTTGSNLDPGITMQAAGFLVQQSANTAAETYVAAVQYPTSGSTRHLEDGSFTGNAGTTTVTLGRQPKAVLLYNATNPRIGFKFAPMAGNSSAELSSAYAWMATGEVTISATGFSVTGNLNTSGDTIRWLAIFN